MADCTTCKGKGTVLYEMPRPDGAPSYNDIPCPDCSICDQCKLTKRECRYWAVCDG